MSTERAIIYLPPGPEYNRWLDPALIYVNRRGYQLVSVVRDWSNVIKIINRGGAEVAVVVLKDHPPSDRVPRVEYVEEEGPPPTTGQRRPRPIRRDGEG